MTDYEKLKKEFDFSLLKKNQNGIGILEKNLNVIIENYAVLKLLIDELLDFKGKLFDKVYPVGSVFISVSSVSPESLFGGTWEQIQGKFLLAASDTYTAGSEGGAATHNHTTGDCTLTLNQIPSHRHSINLEGGSVDKTKGYVAGASGSAGGGGTAYTAYSGSGRAHNHGNTGNTSNLPPYLVVYMWKRTA